MSSDTPLEDAISRVISSSRFDCVTVDFRGKEFDFTIEFAETINGERYNVCNLPTNNNSWLGRLLRRRETVSDVRERVEDLTNLPLDEAGPGYVTFKSDNLRPDGAAERIRTLAEAVTRDEGPSVLTIRLRALKNPGWPPWTPTEKEVAP